nr:cytochrome b-c1 complex subunit 2, mitochondrial-like [Procambarus clarkii]
MASHAVKPCVLRSVAKRGYVAQAAVKQSSYSLPQHDPKVTTLPSGTVVASLENNAPVSHVALLVKAGSRYESGINQGASHMLRACAGLATKNMTAFFITRNIQQIGGALTAESGREHVLYGVDVIRDNLDAGLQILGEVGTQSVFKPWELKDTIKRIKVDLSIRDPTTIALDLLHSAAFRNTGLGNSLFLLPHRVGKLGTDVLSSYLASTHLANRMAVVGLGVDHDALVSYASSLGLPKGEDVAGSAAYGGGEIRQETGAAVTVVAVAGEGASIGSSDAASLAVAQYILGVGPGTKYGSNAGSVLSKAVAASGGIGMASAININYSDAGLFGYFVIADPSSVDKVVGTVHDTLKKLKVSDAQVAAGKNRVKAALLMASESGGESIEDMGLQALLTGQFISPIAAAAAIDGVTSTSVQAALGKVLAGKLSMSAVGSIGKVPYVDQL